MARGADVVTIVAQAESVAASNGFSVGAGRSLDVQLGNVAEGPTVQISATDRGRRYFTSILTGESEVPISASATALYTGGNGMVCALALDRTAPTGVLIQGNPELVGCGVAANSSQPEAIKVWGSGTLITDLVHSSGDFVSGNSVTIDIAEIRRYAPEITDPYGPERRNLGVPLGGGCAGGPKKAKKDEPVVYEPGRYCGGISLNGGDVTFQAGTYVLVDGDLQINSNTKVQGEGVSFVLTGTSASKVGQVTINGTMSGRLVAPDASSGSPLAGVLIFQDPKANSTKGGTVESNKINGTADLELRGAIYFPKQLVEFTGGMKTGNGCLQLVAWRLAFKGNAVVENTEHGCAEMGVEPLRRASIRLIG
jgi:hypothetical protein